MHASLKRGSVGEALGLEDNSMHASLKRGSVGEALGLEDFSLASSVHASLERESVWDALGFSAPAPVHASLERESVGEALGLNATPADDVGDDGAATFRGAGRAQPARLQTRKRGEQPKVWKQQDETLNEVDEEEPKAGRAQPARLPARKRGEQPARALDNDDDDELNAGGRAQPARLPARKRGEQLKVRKQQNDASPELDEEELNAGGRAQPARLQTRKRGEQRKIWKQPSPEPGVDYHDGQEAVQERVRPKRLPPRSTTARPQADAQHGQQGATPLSGNPLLSPRVRI